MLETKLHKLKTKAKKRSLHSSKDPKARPSKNTDNVLDLERASNWKPRTSVQDANMVHSKITQLKTSGNWSLGQRNPYFDPPRPKTHWNYLLDEMELMHVDFTEERKWKKIVAMVLAHEAKRWHELEDKSLICIVPGRKKSKNLPFSISSHFTPLDYQDHYYMSLYEHDIFDFSNIPTGDIDILSSIDMNIKTESNDSLETTGSNPKQVQAANTSSVPSSDATPNQGSINPASIAPPVTLRQTREEKIHNIDLPLYLFNPNPGRDFYKNPVKNDYLFPANPAFIGYPLQEEPIGFDGLLSSSDSEDNRREASPPLSPLTHPFMTTTHIPDLEEPSSSTQLDPKPKPPLPAKRGWDASMDALLLKLVGIFSSNWNLISETINSQAPRSLSKTSSDCASRFNTLSQTAVPHHTKEIYRGNLLKSDIYRKSNILDSSPDKREASFVELIKKYGMRNSKLKAECQPSKNTTLHETHETLEKNSSLHNPMEMSIRKSDIDRQLKAAQQQFQRSSNPIVQAQFFSQLPNVQQPVANGADQVVGNPAQQIPLRVQPNMATGSFVRPVPHIGINHVRPLVLPPRSVPANWPGQPPTNMANPVLSVNSNTATASNPSANSNPGVVQNSVTNTVQNPAANPNVPPQPQAMNVPNSAIPINTYPNAAGLARIPMQNRFTPDQLQYMISNNMMPGIRPGVNVTPAHLAAYMSQFGRVNNPLMNTMGQQNPAVNTPNLVNNGNPTTPQQGRPTMAQQINPQAIQLWQLFIAGRLPNPSPAQMAIIQQIQLISQRRLQNEIQALSLQGMRPNMSRATPEVKVPMDRTNLSSMSIQNNGEVKPNVNPANPGAVPMNNLQNSQNINQMNNNGTPNMNVSMFN
jgi:hypothetical protein